MKTVYLMHKEQDAVGIAYRIPDWLDFNEIPPRSFSCDWYFSVGMVQRISTRTDFVTPITKEVFDILKGNLT
jgi:hypothetical protein